MDTDGVRWSFDLDEVLVLRAALKAAVYDTLRTEADDPALDDREYFLRVGYDRQVHREALAALDATIDWDAQRVQNLKAHLDRWNALSDEDLDARSGGALRGLVSAANEAGLEVPPRLAAR